MKVNKFLPGILVAFLMVSGATYATEDQEPEKIQAKMPVNVKAIIEKSCFGCHNTDSRNEDAKEELDFKLFHELKAFKKIGGLRDMEKVLEKGEMPPKKFLERFPDRKLSDEEVKILTTWVKEEAEVLMKDQ